MDSKRETGEDDRLSLLPDCLLLHILSFLETKHAIATCILSSRWRNLWTFIPNLDFQTYCPRANFGYDESSFVTLVNKSLLNHAANKIHTFRLWFVHREKHASDVDVWLRFAFEKSVEELDLDLGYRLFSSDYYKLPSWLFECQTLVCLKLSRCTFDVPDFGCFSSLVVLSLQFLKFKTRMLRDLLERCPLLEDLAIVYCSFSNTSLCISSSSNSRLKRLEVSGCRKQRIRVGVEVDAPNLQILKFSLEVKGHCSFEDMPSLIEAHVKIDTFESCRQRYNPSILQSSILNLRRAKVLELTSSCIEAMHTPTFKDLHSCIFKTKHLMLKIGLQNVELPGLANLLWSSPDLETLDIDLMNYEDYGSIGKGGFTRKIGFDVKDYWESVTVSFPCLVHSLKSIRISNFIRLERGKCGDLNNEINLVGFLLRNAIVLENITIEAYRNRGEEEWQKILSNVTEKLTAIPQASPYVDMIFSPR